MCLWFKLRGDFSSSSSCRARAEASTTAWGKGGSVGIRVCSELESDGVVVARSATAGSSPSVDGLRDPWGSASAGSGGDAPLSCMDSEPPGFGRWSRSASSGFCSMERRASMASASSSRDLWIALPTCVPSGSSCARMFSSIAIILARSSFFTAFFPACQMRYRSEIPLLFVRIRSSGVDYHSIPARAASSRHRAWDGRSTSPTSVAMVPAPPTMSSSKPRSEP